MDYFSGTLAELLLIFENLKFWKKRSKKRQYDRKHVLPKTKSRYPFQKIIILFLLILLGLFVIRVTLFFWGNAEKHTTEKLSEVVALLKHEKSTSGHYPEHLEVIIRNNPLLKNVNKDYWGREFFYERDPSGEGYVLCSLGKDGQLDTADDIHSEFRKD